MKLFQLKRSDFGNDSNKSPSDLGLLSGHTLVIPTFNRPELLQKLVSYYAKHAQALNLLVLDSSRSQIAKGNAKFAEKFANVRHFIYDNAIPMAQKLASGLDQVETETSSFCADDDIVFPEALVPAIAVLKERSDYVSAHGVYLNFQERGLEVDITLEYSNPSIEADHPGARIFRLCQNYESLFYGVFRTNDLSDIFETTAKVPTLHYQELMQSVTALIKGKVKRLDTFYAARRSGPEAEPGRDRWQTYYWFADDASEFIQHYAIYRDQVWRFYTKHSHLPDGKNLSRRDFNRAMDLSHAVYFSKTCPPRYFHSRLCDLWPNDQYVGEPNEVPDVRAPHGYSAIIEALFRRFYSWKQGKGGDRTNQLKLARASTRRIVQPSISKLNREIASKHQMPWEANFAVDYEWMAKDRSFCEAYHQLCFYLEGAQN